MKAPSGSILIVVLLALFLLTSLGISYVALTHGGKPRAPSPVARGEALGSAQAGVAEALARMSAPCSPLYVGEKGGINHPGWGRYLVAGPGDSRLDPEYDATLTDGLDNDGDGAVDEPGERYPENGSKPVAAVALDHRDTPWVKVRYKLDRARQVVNFGDHDDDPSTPPVENPSRGVPKLIVTAAGRSTTGSKVVTVEAVKWPLPQTPAALYVEGALGFQDSSFRVDGRDHEERAPHDTIPGLPSLPGVASPADVHAIVAGLTGTQTRNILGSGGEPSAQVVATNLDLKTIASAWSRNADLTLVGDQVDPNLAARDSSREWRTIVVKGRLSLSGSASGAGVLVVDGDLDLSGAFHWTGLILCLGDARFHGDGSGMTLVGSVLVQGTVAGQSELAGDASILYSSGVMRRIAAMTGYEVSSWIDQ